MIKMEIQIEVNKNSRYTADQIKDRIDEVAKERGITRKDNRGCFLGNNDKRDYSNFGKIVLQLKKQDWFLPFVKKWVLYVDDERDDLAKHYTKNSANAEQFV